MCRASLGGAHAVPKQIAWRLISIQIAHFFIGGITGGRGARLILLRVQGVAGRRSRGTQTNCVALAMRDMLMSKTELTCWQATVARNGTAAGQKFLRFFGIQILRKQL